MRLIPQTNSPSSDSVMTPLTLARGVVQHFPIRDTACEPCAGDGAFLDALHEIPGLEVDWYEIDSARKYFCISDGDFLAAQVEKKYAWIVTNPPFSKLAQFLKKSFEVADNVVFLCPINAAIGLKLRVRLAQEAGFGVQEIALVDTPPAPWPQSGFQIAAIWWQRGYNGPIGWHKLPEVYHEQQRLAG